MPPNLPVAAPPSPDSSSYARSSLTWYGSAETLRVEPRVALATEDRRPGPVRRWVSVWTGGTSWAQVQGANQLNSHKGIDKRFSTPTMAIRRRRHSSGMVTMFTASNGSVT